MRRGWRLADRAFRQELLERMKERLGAEYYGEERMEALDEPTEGIVHDNIKNTILIVSNWWMRSKCVKSED